MKFLRTIFPSAKFTGNRSQNFEQFKLSIFDEVLLDQQRRYVVVDGKRMRCSSGAWCFYVPKFELKVLHSRDGKLTCLHENAPSDADLANPKTDFGIYDVEEWKGAMEKDAVERAAENYVAAALLAKANLGPKPFGVCLIRNLSSLDYQVSGIGAGVYLQNLYKLKSKNPATREEMIAAGVEPDKLGSSIRQQIRGYISDLNSVVGSRPLAHDREVSWLTNFMRECLEMKRI